MSELPYTIGMAPELDQGTQHLDGILVLTAAAEVIDTFSEQFEEPALMAHGPATETVNCAGNTDPSSGYRDDKLEKEGGLF